MIEDEIEQSKAFDDMASQNAKIDAIQTLGSNIIKSEDLLKTQAENLCGVELMYHPVPVNVSPSSMFT